MIVARQQFLGNTCNNIYSSYGSFENGHEERDSRKNKIAKLITKFVEVPNENCRISVKKGPLIVELSLKELEEDYESRPEWQLIKEGGVLSVPVEELRMENLPKPDRSGQVIFKEMKGGQGKEINNYPVSQSINNINEMLRENKPKNWSK